MWKSATETETLPRVRLYRVESLTWGDEILMLHAETEYKPCSDDVEGCHLSNSAWKQKQKGLGEFISLLFIY